MYIPKRYGESKVNHCPFCGKAAYSQNKQKIPVCKEHKDKQVTEIRCACGSWLNMKQGKYGTFFTCLNCGAINMKKALEMNSISSNELYKVQQKKIEKKEMTISSEELDFL